ncbi:MAG TPA: alpha/beta fold hydrolase [Candidatus Dormibacteraeota bacterium]|nr:alpha/beta fold hydrolase [Candidatus Dormibacteraeota bacterium]
MTAVDRRGPGWAVAPVDDGVSLEYEIAGEGPQLVWCHGLGGCLETERRTMELLARDFQVLWFSSRGHGRSTPIVDRERYAYSLFARDLSRLLDHAGWENPLCAGGSHGANTLLRHQATHPGRARALCLIAPGGNALRRPEPQVLEGIGTLIAMASAAGRDGMVQAATGQIPGAPGADQVLIDAVDSCDLESLAAAMSLVPDQNAVDAGALPSFDLPVHVIAWDGDPIIHPIAVARELVSLIPGATFQEIERILTLTGEEVARLGAEVMGTWARGVLAATPTA